MVVEGTGSSHGNTEVIVGISSVRRLLSKKKLLITVGAIIVVLAIGVGLYALLHGSSKVAAPKATTTTASNGTKPLTVAEQNQQELAQAKQVVANDKKNGTSSQNKALHYADLGNAYLNAGDAQSAITAFKNEASADSTFQSGAWSGLMKAYSNLGQFTDALTYANKLLAYYQSSQYSDPSKASNISYLQGQITQLKAGERI